MHEDGHAVIRARRPVMFQTWPHSNMADHGEMGLDYLERNLMRTTRRTFLSAAGAAGLSAVYVDSASAKIEPEPWGIKLGIATYTYRKFERAKAIEFIKAVQTPWISIKADQPPTAGANQQLPGLPAEGQPLAADAAAQLHAAR